MRVDVDVQYNLSDAQNLSFLSHSHSAMIGTFHVYISQATFYREKYFKVRSILADAKKSAFFPNLTEVTNPV